MKLGTFCDATHTASANVLQRAGAKAAVFMGDRVSFAHEVQAKMRLRGLLDPRQNQTITCVYQKDLACRIETAEGGALSPERTQSWTVGHLAEQMRIQIGMNALSEVAYLCEAPTIKFIRAAHRDPARQMKLFAHYRSALVDAAAHDPYAQYGEPLGEKPTESVLRSFATEKTRAFKSTVPQNVETWIQAVAQRIPSMAAASHTLAGEVQMHTQLQQQTHRQNYRPRPFDPLEAAGVYGDLKFSAPHFPRLAPMRSARDVFGTQGLSGDLYLSTNQLRTAVNAGTQLEAGFLKPIDFFLIIFEGSRRIAYVPSNEILGNGYRDLIDVKADPATRHQLMVVNAEGKLCLQGKGPLAPTPDQVKETLSSQWLQDLVIDAALLRGQIAHPLRLLERLATWKDFDALWKRVLDALPNPETASQEAMRRLRESPNKTPRR